MAIDRLEEQMLASRRNWTSEEGRQAAGIELSPWRCEEHGLRERIRQISGKAPNAAES